MFENLVTYFCSYNFYRITTESTIKRDSFYRSKLHDALVHLTRLRFKLYGWKFFLLIILLDVPSQINKNYFMKISCIVQHLSGKKYFYLSCYLGELYALEVKWSKLHGLPMTQYKFTLVAFMPTYTSSSVSRPLDVSLKFNTSHYVVLGLLALLCSSGLLPNIISKSLPPESVFMQVLLSIFLPGYKVQFVSY
jgi:hypothetical protein